MEDPLGILETETACIDQDAADQPVATLMRGAHSWGCNDVGGRQFCSLPWQQSSVTARQGEPAAFLAILDHPEHRQLQHLGQVLD